MCSIDLEPASVWKTSVVIARKEHECDCCGGTIRKGFEYTRHFSICDGDVFGEKMCRPCSTMCAGFRAEHGQVTVPSQMVDLLHECAVDDPKDAGKRWRLELLGMDRRAKARQRRLAKFAGDGATA